MKVGVELACSLLCVLMVTRRVEEGEEEAWKNAIYMQLECVSQELSQDFMLFLFSSCFPTVSLMPNMHIVAPLMLLLLLTRRPSAIAFL